MKVYRTDEIRNVVLLGHGGSGKTSLVEAMSYISGATSRMGKISEGNTISDFDKEEQKREFSITTSLVPIEWEKAKINILDTPGYFDFVGEVEEAVSAADAAVIVVSGKAGVEVGTEKAWELCEKYNLPRMVYVTEMDVDDASFRQVVEDLTARYGKCIAPRAIPIRENEKLVGYVNVIKNAGRRFTEIGQREECEIPDYCMPNLEICRNTLLEAVAETSDDFMERYFAGEEFSIEEIRAALRTNVMDGSIVPVGMGSNLQAQGVVNLLSDIVRFFPSPDKRECAGINRTTNEIFEANYDFAKSKTAYVFKTMVDPFIGKYSLIKVCSGVLKGDDILYNAAAEAEAKPGKLYTLIGNKPVEVPELFAGDIGAVAKLTATKTGDTLSSKTSQVLFGKTEYSVPYTYMKYTTPTKGDEDKVSQALAKMMAEDVTLKTVNDSENRQALLYGMGDQHLEVVASKLQSRYKVEINLETPRVAFRETIRKNSDVDTKYKKQSGGHGQYGHVKMTFEPSGNLEAPYVFEEKVVGGAVPRNYFPAVEKGLQDSVGKGPLAGYPVVGVKATLYDGSYHPVDSSEQAFKTATVQAFKKGFMEAGPVLLEPIASLKVTVPDDYTGDVMGDLNKRRGRVLGMTPIAGGKQIIEADIPMTGLFGYCTVLRSMTGGRGTYAYEFARYEQAPSDVQEKEIAARAADE
ncbi:elongation factor G [Hespellia stercorisuis]|uniref:Translation elongation factor 2 (EF-2/EF-G) n=1 Tax=Hespellia stercorisuis DSM 15480 TaxID=1121950 RepID=A0A1M6Q7C2_9FIRM|nr:elongation factor G [Hespellia stercorisuis]SHK16040.1 translation elongation factor 2 (EF-2/EF-G) [Hespellia stercorisuis DSM 15480]